MSENKKSTKRPGLVFTLIIIVIGLAVVILDQSTKIVARDTLKDKPTASYLGGLVNTEYRENDGAFLGLGGDWPDPIKRIVLVGLPLIVCILGIIWIFLSKKLLLSDRIIILIILAGGISNLWDRILFGKVSDFLFFKIGDFKFTGVVNFADMAVTFGVLTLLGLYIARSIKERKDKQKAAE